MTHIGQELALGPIGCLSLVQGYLQLMRTSQ